MKHFQSTKGGESLPLAPKQSCLSATPSSGDTPQRPEFQSRMIYFYKTDFKNCFNLSLFGLWNISCGLPSSSM